jgi:hypothetical protein
MRIVRSKSQRAVAWDGRLRRQSGSGGCPGFVYPVVQGRGCRLFPHGFECPKLRLVEAKAFQTGITYSGYARF